MAIRTLFVLVAGLLPLLVRGQASQHALRFFGTGVGPPAQQDRARFPIDDNAAGPDASAPCDLGAGDFTVEFWLRGSLEDNDSLSSSEGDHADNRWISGNIVVDRDIWGASDRDWGISIAGGRVRFGTGRGDSAPLDSEHTLEGGTRVLDGAWHHVACVRESASGVKRIYVDGVLDVASAVNRSRDDISYPDSGDTAPMTPWGPYIVLAAEKHDAGASYPSFNGYLDELRLWSVARSASELAASYGTTLPGNTAGMAGYYRFEEGAGTTLADSSTAGSPAGTLIAGVAGNGQWVSRATDAANTAPVVAPGPLPPQATLTLASVPPGIPLWHDGVPQATPYGASFASGSLHTVEAPAAWTRDGTTFLFRAWSDRAARAHTVTLGGGDLTLRAGFYAAAQGVVTSVVAAAGRDAESHPSEGIAFGNAYDPAALCAGRDDDGIYQAAMAFALPLPREAEVIAAHLRLRPTADHAGSPSWSLRSYDLDQVPLFATAPSGTLTGLHPLTPPVVAWSPDMFASGLWVESPDLTLLVTNVTRRAGWLAGQFLAVVIDGTASPLNAWRCWGNFASGTPPQLIVTYRTGATDDADLDDDGMDDAWELARGLDCTLPADATQDADGDGASNIGEYVADTDPRDASRRLIVAAYEVGERRLAFTGSTARVYRAVTATTPHGPWEGATPFAPGSGGHVELTLPADGATQRFFRVEAALP